MKRILLSWVILAGCAGIAGLVFLRLISANRHALTNSDLVPIFEVLTSVVRGSRQTFTAKIKAQNDVIILDGEGADYTHLRLEYKLGQKRATDDEGMKKFQHGVAMLLQQCGEVELSAKTSGKGVSSITVSGFKPTWNPWIRTVHGVTTAIRLPGEERWRASDGYR